MSARCTAIDADIVGLMEIENDGGAEQRARRARRCAQRGDVRRAPTRIIDTGVIGTDEIKVALIYKPAAVTPVGACDILTTADRPAVHRHEQPAVACADVPADLASGQMLTVVVNHLKSKGSDCDGHRRPRHRRRRRATATGPARRPPQALVDWLATDPTGSGDPDFLIIGDMNSYTFETPITTFEADGFTNLVRQFHGLDAYSYVFNGESGYLDHALATASLAVAGDGRDRLAHQPGRADRARLQHRVQDGEPGQHVLRPGAVPRLRPRPRRHRGAARPRARRPTPAAPTRSPRARASPSPPPAQTRTGDTLTYAWDLDNDGALRRRDRPERQLLGRRDRRSRDADGPRPGHGCGRRAVDEATVT